MFSKMINSLAKIGFVVTLVIVVDLAVRISRYSSFFMEPAVTFILIICIGTLLAIVIWGMVGTVSEIGVNSEEIRQTAKNIDWSFLEDGEDIGRMLAGGKLKAGWICSKCGKKCGTEALFCIDCGTPRDQKDHNTRTEGWICKNCGKEDNKTDARFCSKCGAERAEGGRNNE